MLRGTPDQVFSGAGILLKKSDDECEYSLVVRPGALGEQVLGGGLVAPVPMEVVGNSPVVCNFHSR